MRAIWQKTFFYQLQQRNRLLLWIIIGWLAINAGLSVFRHQTTPFYQWPMYAPPLPERAEYQVYDIVYNGRHFRDPHTWNDFMRLMVTYTLNQYLELTDTAVHPPAYAGIRRLGMALHINTDRYLQQLHPGAGAIANYPAWLSDYLAALTGEPVHSLQVQELTVRYRGDGSVYLVASKPVLSL